MGKTLSMDEIQALTRQAAKDNNHSKAYQERWPRKPDLLLLKAAVAAHAKTVTLGRRMFNLLYRGDKVWVSPSRDCEFAPCGWFALERLREPDAIIEG